MADAERSLIDSKPASVYLAGNQVTATIARCVTLNVFCGLFSMVVTGTIDATLLALLTAGFGQYWNLKQAVVLMFFTGSVSFPIGYILSTLGIGPIGPRTEQKSKVWSMVASCMWLPTIVILTVQFYSDRFTIHGDQRDIAIICTPALTWFWFGQIWGNRALKLMVARDQDYDKLQKSDDYDE